MVQFSSDGRVFVGEKSGIVKVFDNLTGTGVIVGSTTSVSAPSPIQVGGTQYVFDSWSDGGAASHLITAGVSPATYTATYRPPP